MTPEQHEIERRRAWVAFAIERAKTAQPFERQEKAPMVGGYRKVAVTVSMQAAGFASDMLAAYDARFPAPVEREAAKVKAGLPWTRHGRSGPMPEVASRFAFVDVMNKDGSEWHQLCPTDVDWSEVSFWRPHETDEVAEPSPTEPDWIDHTPGNPMPCDPVQKVRVRFRGGTKDIGRARQFFWGTTPYTPDGEVIQWKLAQ